MSLPADLLDVPGAQELHDWFGRWPSFHDAKLLCVQLERSGPSVLKFHTWNMTRDVDEKGFFVLTNHVIVDFVLENIHHLELEDFKHQNIIFEMSVEKVEPGYELSLDDVYGIHGSLIAEGLSIRHYPCTPDGNLLPSDKRT